MLTIDEFVRDFAVELSMGPSLLDAASVATARLYATGPAGVHVIIRVKPELAHQISECRQYESCLQMMLNTMACHAAMVDHYTEGEILPCHNELMAMSLYDIGMVEQWGIKVNLEKKRLTVPQVPLAKLMAASEAGRKRTAERIRRRLGPWGCNLLQVNWFETDEAQEALGVQITFVPDLPSDDLADSHLEQAICVSHGWNFTSLYTPADMKEAIASLRRALLESQTFITY